MNYKTLIIIWLVTDAVLFITLYCLAYFLRVGFILSTNFEFDRFLMITIFTAPFWLLTITTTRTFALTRTQSTPRNGAYIAYGAIVGVAFFTVIYYFRYEAFFSRLLLVYAFFFTFVGTWLWHIFFEKILRHILYVTSAFPTLIVGITRESKNLMTRLHNTRNPLKPVAILNVHGIQENEINGVPVLGKLNKLEETIINKRITHLIQCADLEQSLNLLSTCRNHDITYMLLPSVLGIVERDERIETLEGQPVTVVSPKKNHLLWFFR